MRILLMITAVLTIVASIYKWRYRLLNIILAVGIIRRFFVRFSLSMPKLFMGKNKA